MFEADKLPKHLRMNVRVTDEKGEPVAAGRDVSVLQRTFGGAASAAFTQSAAGGGWNRDGLTAWTWGDLPASVALPRGDVTLKGYPAVVDRRDSVGLRLMDTPRTRRARDAEGSPPAVPAGGASGDQDAGRSPARP